MYKSIKELKDKHVGEDIWVILAGSSMDYINPDFFKGKVTLGQNQVYRHFPTTYVVMKDCMEQPRFPRSIQELEQLKIPLIFSRHYKGYRAKTENTPLHSNSYVFDHNPRQASLEKELLLLKEDDIVTSRSSTTSLLHIAAYMGASNIILAGHDCGTLDDKLYYSGYVEEDWTSSGNWSGIVDWMEKLEKETVLVREYLTRLYKCNIYSLNPFLNFGLEDHVYKPSN